MTPELDRNLGQVEGQLQKTTLIENLEGSETSSWIAYGSAMALITTGTLLLFAEDLGWTDTSAQNVSFEVSPAGVMASFQSRF